MDSEAVQLLAHTGLIDGATQDHASQELLVNPDIGFNYTARDRRVSTHEVPLIRPWEQIDG
jgi:hypothetical protein